LLLDTLLHVCRERKLLKARGRQRTDATHVLAAIRVLNRLECVGETLRHALNSLAVVAPQWVRAQCPAEWVERYGPRVENYRLPASKAERGMEADRIGRDGHVLLAALYAEETPHWLREVPAVETLRQVWVQQYYIMEESVQWRSIEVHGIPPAHLFINSPYDPQAHCAAKRSLQWVGYRVHLTETCDADCPRLVTHVETTAAPIPDNETLPDLHSSLKAKDLLLRTHLVDSGYIDADLLVTTSKDYGVDLCDHPEPIITGRRKQLRGLRRATSRLIGSVSRQRAQPGGSVPAGNRPWIVAEMRSSVSGLLSGIVARVRIGRIVRTRCMDDGG
jgi:transposase